MVPVTVLTGFLGSGKTTLLNRLLSDPAIKDTAVIVNEFGEIGLDHLLIESAVENTVLMKSGCICCTVRGDIVDTIEDLLARRDAGLIPGFSRIVIETTGLADPAPVVYTLATEAGETCRLDGIVTTVDAVNGLNELAQFPEAMKQVAIADRIVLTKQDLATPAEIAAIEARLGGFPAPILRQADPANLFGLASDVTVAHPHHDHASGIDSTVLEHDAPVPWPALAFWLEAITSLRGDDLLRIKGLVDITGETKPVVIHAVQHVIHPPTVLERWPAADRRTRIVVIGRGLDPAGLKQAFLACLDATAGPQPSLREGQ